jgi:two-component system CheB/CheR fusion protein
MAFRLFEGNKELPRESQPLQRAARTSEAVSNWEGQLENQRGDRVHVMISASPLFTEAGGTRGAVAVIVDISQHKHAEAQQQFLLGELQHRVKNILATVVSLGTRMARGQSSVEEFRGAFLDRLLAMGRTHDLLTAGAWSGTSVRSLVEAALGPYVTTGKGDVVVDGPAISLAAGPATTLGMVFHELATNASKYGALSKVGGHVEISWRLLETEQAGGQRLGLSWTESGGPPVEASSRSGFGTAFITRSVEYELGGRASLDFAPEGLRCTIEFPYGGAIERHSPAETT